MFYLFSYIKLSMPKVSLATSLIAIFNWPSRWQTMTKKNLSPEPEYQGMLERKEMKRQHSSSLFDTRPRGDFTQLHIPTKCIKILLGKWFERLGNMSAAMMIASTSNDFLSCPRELWSKSFLELINVGGKSPFSHQYQFYISSCLTLCGTQNFGTYI